MSSAHRRVASDNISMSSQSQAGDGYGFPRLSSVSAESRQWLPMEGTWNSSPPMNTSATAWSEGGDLGAISPPMVSPQLNPGPSFSHQGPTTPRLSTIRHSPATGVPSPRSRPKPAPFQFDDSVTDYSPAGSSRSMFSPLGRFQHRRTDSRSNLLNTPSTPWRSPRTPPPYSATMPRPRRCWQWRPAWVMYLFFVFGLLCAVGHHVFYSVLDGRPAEDQLAMLRYGAMLAFAAKAGLMAAVVVAFKQRIWTTVRSRLLSVAALDSLFAATEDLSALLNVEVYKRAKVAMLLAVFVWLTPLVVILTSNTLTVEPAMSKDNATCPGIRTLNFVKEELEQWREATKIDNLFGLSVSTWNTTSTNVSSPDWFDYYTASSEKFVQIATHAVYMEQAISKAGANMDICGPGWNCTYTVNFTAPAYKCAEVASGVGSEIEPLGDQKPPDGFTTDLLVPKGNYSYYAFTNGGEYSNMQVNDTWPGGIPKTDPPFPQDLGAFRTEPVIWVGYSVRVNPNEVPPTNSSVPGWEDAFVPKVFACENYEADYTVEFNLTGGQQFTNVTERTFVRRLIDTTWDQGEMANDGTNDNTTARPKSNYVSPRDEHRYRRVAAFHSMGSQLRYFVNGTIDSQQVNNPIQNTKAIQTKLLDPRHEYFAYPNIQERIQGLYEDIIFSLFSNQQFLSVVWAANPDVISGTVKGNESTAYPCERSQIQNIFSYHARDLWIVYGLAVVLALAGVVSGTRAVLENEGVLRNTRFSSIVAATRGPALEKVGWSGAEDKGDVPRDIKGLKVGYGIVHRPGGLGVLQEDTRYPERTLWDAGVLRYGFGLEGDVRQMRSEGSLFRGR